MVSANSEMKLELPRGVSIRKHGADKKSIQIAFSYKGEQCRESLRDFKLNASGVADAARLLARIKREIKDGAFEYGSEFPQSKAAARLEGVGSGMTVQALLEEYFKERESILAPSTLRAYRSMAKKRIYPGLGDKRLRDLTLSKVIGWLGSGKLRGYSLKYVRNILTPLRRALYFAAYRDYIPRNPIPPGDLDIKSETPKEHWGKGNQADPFDRSEIERLLTACESAEARNLFQFAFASGLRCGELIGLRWQDVDFDKNKVCVNITIVSNDEKSTKTPKGTRVVDLLPAALAALIAQREISAHKTRVFCQPVTGLIFRNSDQVRDLWIRAIEQAKIRYRPPKQTRHTYASIRISEEPNLNLFYLADQLGHEGTDMINRHYAVLIKERDRSAAQEAQIAAPMPASKTKRRAIVEARMRARSLRDRD
jgi:integrase